MKHASLLIAFLLLTVGVVQAQDTRRATPPRDSAPVINVIYPPAGQAIGPVDSTFIIGSVTPGSKLRINGQPVSVYRTGGFLAWLGVDPGDFVFRLRAKNDLGSDSLDVPVTIADNRPIPASEGAKIRDVSLRPLWNRTVHAGDEVSVSFDGTVGGKARYWIVARRDSLGPFPMIELKSRSLANYEAYRRDEMLAPDSMLGDAQPARGRYHGIWTVPAGLREETLKVDFELTMTGPKPGKVKARAPGLLIPVDSRPPRVVELTDSIQILRTGPRMGYFAINQPYGVRARWWGENGPWTLVEPSPGQEAWIETAKTSLLPEGTPLPETIIPRLSTVATARSVRLVVGTTERLPFRITVDDDLHHASLLIFGATSNTDFVEQDSTDSMIGNVVWSQAAPEVYRIDVDLKQPLWGYDARYEADRLIWEFYRSPLRDSTLQGLRICVDPGHSADPGSVGPTGLVEKDANLHIAKALKSALEAMGATVIMTRMDDEDVPLQDRPVIAQRDSADLFVSVHNNAVPDGVNPLERNGTGTFFHHPQSRDLAKAVHRDARLATGLADYGLTQANFAVIRPWQYPAILIECAFMIIPDWQ